MPISVAIVEGENNLSEELRALIEANNAFRCLGAFDNAENALENIPTLNPDVVLIDTNVPVKSGIGCVRSLRDTCPQTQILMLAAREDSEMVFQSLANGANGYLLKGSPPTKVLEGIEAVRRGESQMSTTIARRVLLCFHEMGHSDLLIQNLSPREEEILAHLARGHHDQEIAGKLSISANTVRSHLYRIYDKLQARWQSQ